jgi:hypothetical protein
VAVRDHDILAASVDGSVRRFDIRLGRMYVDELHHPITGLAVSHDSLCILAACLDSTLRLLDKSSGEVLAEYTGHVHQVWKMVWAELVCSRLVRPALATEMPALHKHQLSPLQSNHLYQLNTQTFVSRVLPVLPAQEGVYRKEVCFVLSVS